MRRAITLAALGAGTVFGAALPAFAQSGDGEWKADFEVTAAGGAIEDETPLAPSAPSVIGSATVTVTRSDTFENGLTLGWRGEVRLERDAPSRRAFAGVLGACPAADVACPRIADGSGFLSPVSPATGLAVSGPVRDDGAFLLVGQLKACPLVGRTVAYEFFDAATEAAEEGTDPLDFSMM